MYYIISIYNMIYVCVCTYERFRIPYIFSYKGTSQRHNLYDIAHVVLHTVLIKIHYVDLTVISLVKTSGLFNWI